MLDNAPSKWRKWWESEGEPSYYTMIAEVRQTR